MASEAVPSTTEPPYDANEAEAVYQEFMEEDTPGSPNPDIELFGVVLRAFVQMLKQIHGQGGSNPRESYLTSRRLSKSSVLSVLINSEVHGKPYRRSLFNTRKFRRIICTAHVMNELSKFSSPKNEDLVSILSSVYKDFSADDEDNAATETVSSNGVAGNPNNNAVAVTPNNSTVAGIQSNNGVAGTHSNNAVAETPISSGVAGTSSNNAVAGTSSNNAVAGTSSNNAVAETPISSGVAGISSSNAVAGTSSNNVAGTSSNNTVAGTSRNNAVSEDPIRSLYVGTPSTIDCLRMFLE